MASQCTKYEVSNYTHYEDMRSGAKCTNWGSWGRLIGNVTIRQSAYDFLFDFNRNHASILYRFRDIASYLSKVADFNPPHLQLAPHRGCFRSNFAVIFDTRKLESLGYRVYSLCDPMFIRFSRTPTCDGQTQTQGHGHVFSIKKSMWQTFAATVVQVFVFS